MEPVAGDEEHIPRPQEHAPPRLRQAGVKRVQVREGRGILARPCQRLPKALPSLEAQKSPRKVGDVGQAKCFPG